MALSEALAHRLINNERSNIQKSTFYRFAHKVLILNTSKLRSQTQVGDLKLPVISSDESATTLQHRSVDPWIVHVQFVLPNHGKKQKIENTHHNI